MKKTSPDNHPRLRLAGLLPVLRSFAAMSLFALAPLAGGQVIPSPAPEEGIPAANDPVPGANLAWTATARDGLTTTWEATETSTNFLTGEVTSTPHRYTEMGSGLNYLDPALGQYVPSQDLIELSADGGAAALRGPAKLFLKPNLNTEGAIGQVRV